jgi:hypothetical protein
MSFRKGSRAVYGDAGDLICYVPIDDVERHLRSGRLREVKRRNRPSALVALSGAWELLRAARPPVGQRYSHKRETATNPPGVWTFKCLTFPTCPKNS